MTIEERNDLRRSSGLPLLSTEQEKAKTEALRTESEFETFYQREKSKYNHLQQQGNGRGFLTGMGINIKIRRLLRDEFNRNRTSSVSR